MPLVVCNYVFMHNVKVGFIATEHMDDAHK